MSSPLLIRIYSFSYLYGVPLGDPTGNGGGFVFDCRGIPNPGKQPGAELLTGFDESVRAYFDLHKEAVSPFLENCLNLVISTATEYNRRGFTDLQIAFGCTGGRHRSVYCANALSETLTKAGYTTRVVHWQLEQSEKNFFTRRGMILGAGFGTRLKPLTDNKPKVLVEAGGKPMLDWCAEALINIGVKEIVVNAHHFSEQVNQWAEAYQSKHPGISIIVSNEPEILGTGGGIRQAAKFLHSPEPVFIHNGDIYTEIDLEALYAVHRTGDFVTLACQDRPASSHLLVDDGNRLCGITSPKQGDRVVTEPRGKLRKLGFTGIHLMSHKWLEWQSGRNDFSIIDSYLKAVSNGVPIRVVEVAGAWFEMGNPERLRQLDDYLKTKQRA